MKKIAVIALSFLLTFCFAGCAQLPAPEQAADGASWSDGWVTVGNVVGVDTPEGEDTVPGYRSSASCRTTVEQK